MTPNDASGSGTELPEPQAAPDLQFDKAEYDQPAPGLLCKTCGQPIAGEYYLINGEYSCGSCKAARDTSAVPERSSASRFVRAGIYGAGAAVAGSLIYLAVLFVTGYDFALVAILVGWMVGKAVLHGSENHGGRAYQCLAVLLTYCSIASGYIPSLLDSMRKFETQQTTSSSTPNTGARPDKETAPKPEKTPLANEIAAAGDAGEDLEELQPLLDGLGVAVLFIFAVGFSFIAPFVVGYRDVLSLVILGLGLYEAWKHSAKRVDSIEGPFTASPASAASATVSA